jgi:oxygen-dependent protoporphyrinogen oxidase
VNARRRVVVAGGGITGLAAAYRLLVRAEGRLDVTLLEASPRLGGSLLTIRRDGYVFDGGPDAFVAAKPHATRLCEELGLGGELMGTRPESRRVYFRKKGRLFHLPEGLVLAVPTQFWPLVTSPLFSLGAVLRMGLDLVARGEPPERDESIASFLRRHLGQEAVDVLGEPLLGGIYSGDPHKLSIRATFPQLVELERKHGSLVRGAIAQRASAPKPAPGVVPKSMFQALRGGMAALPERLAERIRALGGAIRTEARVEAIRENPGEFAIETSIGSEPIPCDELIVALPAPAAARLLAPLDREAGRALEAVPHVSTATCLLAYERTDVPHPLDAAGVLLPKSEGRQASALTFMSSKWDHRVPEGKTLLRVFFGGYAHPEVRELADDALLAMAREELRVVLGVEAAPVTWEVFRWNDCRPQPIVGHLDRVRLVRERLAARRGESGPGLEVAGGPYDGVGIPDCIRQADEAAGRVLERLRAAAAP